MKKIVIGIIIGLMLFLICSPAFRGGFVDELSRLFKIQQKNMIARKSGVTIGDSRYPINFVGMKIVINDIQLDAGITINGDYSGITTTVTVDANTVGFGSALFLSADGHYDETDADQSTTMPCLVLALETGTGSKKVLLQGYICETDWDWTLGAGVANLIYVSTVTGTLTQTAPAGAGDQVQIVGHAVSPDIIYFKPNFLLIEI